ALSPAARQYFANYYHRNSAPPKIDGTPTYVTPTSTQIDGGSNPPGDVRLLKSGSKLYLVIAGAGIGDVYELNNGDSILAKVKKTGTTPNSKAAGLAAPGAFYGDEITFTSVSSALTPPTVNWTFAGDTTLYPR